MGPPVGVDVVALALAHLLAWRQVFRLAEVCLDWQAAFKCDTVWLSLIALRWGQGACDRAQSSGSSEVRGAFAALQNAHLWQARLLAGERDGRLRAKQGWFALDRDLEALFISGHSGGIAAASLDVHIGARLATCGHEGAVQLWCLRSGAARAKFGVKCSVTHVSLCGDWLVAASADDKVHFVVLCEGGAVMRKHRASIAARSAPKCVEVLSSVEGAEGEPSAMLGLQSGAVEILSMASGDTLHSCSVDGEGALAMRVARSRVGVAIGVVTLSTSFVVQQWSVPDLHMVRRCALPEELHRAPSGAATDAGRLASLSVHGGAVVLALGEKELHWHPLAINVRGYPLGHRSATNDEGDGVWHRVKVDAGGPIHIVGGDSLATLYLDRGARSEEIRVAHTQTGLALGGAVLSHWYSDSVRCPVPVAVASEGAFLLSTGNAALLTRPCARAATRFGAASGADADEDDGLKKKRREKKPKMRSQKEHSQKSRPQ